MQLVISLQSVVEATNERRKNSFSTLWWRQPTDTAAMTARRAGGEMMGADVHMAWLWGGGVQHNGGVQRAGGVVCVGGVMVAGT